MMDRVTGNKIYYTLRIACAMCFIGHGAFGIITKQTWCNYFGVFGIDAQTAYALMPYVGLADVLMGLLMLFYPVRIAFVWLIVWGMFTASLRPLSGEPFAEFIERAGNYGAPLALLLLTYSKGKSRLFRPLFKEDVQLAEITFKRVNICLRVVVFLLFLGHGWLNLIEKKALLDQYGSLDFSNAAAVAKVVGTAEIVAAFITLIKPFHAVLLLFFVWKITSELFYPHWEVFEWIERGGSYGAILALWFITKHSFYYTHSLKQKKLSVA